MAKPNDSPALPIHGARVLPSVTVDSYNLEIQDQDGFLGDKASKSAFWDILDKWRKPLKEIDQDPLGITPSDEVSKKRLASLLAEGKPKEAGLVQSAVEDFAQRLTSVIRRFMRLKEWRKSQCVVIGGGFSASQIGRLTVGRSALLLKSEGIDLDLEVIHSHPDEAGLLGAVHLLPPWMLKGYDGIAALDIGGTNIRAGIVQLNLKKSAELAQARVAKRELWRHGDEKTGRDDAVDRMTAMLKDLISWAEADGLRLAPVVGIGCPGIIAEDGSILRGAQNLPGNWGSSRFNVVNFLREQIPKIGKDETIVVMHNDAVVQGLSELPQLQDRLHWAVLTIGTGLGNASFTNRHLMNSRSSKRQPSKGKT
jgi:ROK family